MVQNSTNWQSTTSSNYPMLSATPIIERQVGRIARANEVGNGVHVMGLNFRSSEKLLLVSGRRWKKSSAVAVESPFS